MYPIGAVSRHAVGMKRKFALFIRAGFCMIAAGVRDDYPAFPQRRVDHCAPLALVACFAHPRVRVFHDRENIRGVCHPFLPPIGITGGEVAGEPLDKGAFFHGRGTPAHWLPFHHFRDGSAAG